MEPFVCMYYKLHVYQIERTTLGAIKHCLVKWNNTMQQIHFPAIVLITFVQIKGDVHCICSKDTKVKFLRHCIS